MVGKVRWGLLITVMMAVIFRYASWRNNWPDLVAGQRIQVKDRVVRPVVKVFGKRFLKVGRGGQIQVQIPEEVDINYGDKVTITGTVEERLIDKKLIGFRLIQSDIRVNPASKFQLTMSKWRNYLTGMVLKWLPGDEGGLAVGILWGGGGSLSENTSENFRKAGLTHIIAASGFNVSVVAGWATAMAVKLVGRRRSIYLVIVSIILYVFLAGAQAAVIRAGIMAGLSLIALRLGRRSDAVWVWLLTGVVMLIANPAFVEDVGWELSMAATLGLLLTGDFKSGGIFMSDLKTTLAALVMTLPIILHYFGGVSIVSPLTNILVLWTIPIIMQIVGVASLVGLIFGELGMVVSWVSWPLLRWVILVTQFFSTPKWLVPEVGEIGWEWVAGYYLLLAIIVYKKR